MTSSGHRAAAVRMVRGGAITLATLGGFAAGASAAPYGFSTFFEGGAAWYDHASSFQAPARFTAGSFAPGVDYRAETPTQRLFVSARRGFTYFHGPAIDSLTRAGAPQTLDNASLAFERLGPNPNLFRFAGSYERSRDVLDMQERIFVNPVDAIRWSGDGSLTMPFVEASTASHGWYYPASDLTSAISFKGGARVVPLRGALTSLFAAWDERLLVLGQTTTMRAFLAGGGVRRRINPWLDAEVEGGVSGVHWFDGTTASGPAGKLAIHTHSDVAPIFSLEAEARRDIPSTIAAEVGSHLAGGSVRLRGTWEPDVEGGLLRTPQQTARVTLAGEDTLGGANVVGGELGYAYLRPLHFDGPREETIHASAWLLRRLRPWLSARVGGAFVRQPVRDLNEPVYRRMRLDVALIARVPGSGSAPGAW